jgi:hypothetical protein
MKRISEQARTWVVDYSAAREEAIRWLGDRYLLARPINPKKDKWRPVPPVILQSMPAELSEPAASRTDH